MRIYPATKSHQRDPDRWHMSADMAFHWWFLLIALIAFVGAMIARITAEVPPLFRIIVIGGLLGGLIFYRLKRFRSWYHKL